MPVSPALLLKQVECIVFGQRGHARPTTKSDISAEEKTKTLQGSEGAEEQGRRSPMPFYSEVQGGRLSAHLSQSIMGKKMVTWETLHS